MNVNHLLFADDSLLLCKANEEESLEIKSCLRRYGAASGQVINFQKSSIIFGKKVTDERKVLIKNTLGIVKEGGEGAYLGLPECFNGSKVKLMNFIKEKLQGRLHGWFAKTLSQGGKEVLLKSIAMSMPVYAMSCFKLPQETCKKLTSAMTEFWWSNSKEKRKMSWVSWQKMCRKKEEGGLGFRDIGRFNQALLAKQVWRIWEQPSSLLARVMKSRYFKNSNVLDCGMGTRPSYGWRSMMFGRDLLANGLLRTIGDGRDTLVWKDVWLSDGNPRAPSGLGVHIDPHLKVCELMNREDGSWNAPLIRQTFNQRDADLIIATHHNNFESDSFVWGFSTTGRYTTKSGYEVAESVWESSESPQTTAIEAFDKALWKVIWKVKTSPKIRHFLWRALAGALAVGEKLVKRGILVDARCPICGRCTETVSHVLFTCPRAMEIWQASSIPTSQYRFYQSSISSNIKVFLSLRQNIHIVEEVRNALPWILWYIWKDRNAIIFENQRMSPSLVVKKAQDESLDWLDAQTRPIRNGGRDVNTETVSRPWIPPPRNFTKCNIGSSWIDRFQNSGVAWILRDCEGIPLFHSRRSYSRINSGIEAEVHSLFWAMESVSHLHQNQVLFEIQSEELELVVRNPHRLPVCRDILGDISDHLKALPEWKLVFNPCSCNKAPMSLAKIVTDERRYQSYIERGNPPWLRSLL